MNKTEKIVSDINQNVFFKEFTFSKNKFIIPDEKSELELADNVVWLDDILLIYQIKDRNDDAEGSIEKWFDSKVLKKAVTQIKNTLQYFNDYDNISVTNERGHKLNISEANLATSKKIIVYTPTNSFLENLRFQKFYESKKAGLIHLFHSEDYNTICQFLITPSEIDEYLSFRESLYIKHKNDLNELPEQYVLGHFLKTLNVEKLDYSYIENVQKFRKYFLEFDVSFIIENFKNKIIKKGEEKDYYFIIREIAKLDRAELSGFKERWNLSLERAKAQEFTLLYRMTSIRNKCGYVFIPLEFKNTEHWQSALINLTRANKYDQKLDKAIGLVVVYNSEIEFYDINWVYLEYKWKFDSEMEQMLKDNYPFRKVSLKATNKYYFDE